MSVRKLKVLYSEADNPPQRYKVRPALVVAFLLYQTICSAQGQALSYVHLSDSSKEWRCPLPVEATVHTWDKKKITYAIIAADDSGFVALSPITDTAVQNSIEWQRTFGERLHKRNLIESDPSLSHEEQRKLIVEGWVGVLYRDTIRIMAAEVKKIVFHDSDASSLQRTIPLAAYIAAGCVFMVGMIELMVSSDPEIKSTMEAPYPAMLLVAGIGGVVASGSWIFHTYHKVIRPSEWRVRR